MRIEGQFLFNAIHTRAVWDFLTDPGRIALCLPGCEALVKTGEDTYEMTLKIGIGAIRGSFTGTIQLHDLNPVSAYQMTVSGRGTSGFVKGQGRIALANGDSGTQLEYAGDVNAGGAIASVGQRMIGGAARMVIEQFFRCAAEKLAADYTDPQELDERHR